MPFTIEVKHDTQHKTWKRLSVVGLAPDRLVTDLEAHAIQYAADNQMNSNQVAARVVEIDSASIGAKAGTGVMRVVATRESDATANRPQRSPSPSM